MTLSNAALEAAAYSAKKWYSSVHGNCATNYYHHGYCGRDDHLKYPTGDPVDLEHG